MISGKLVFLVLCLCLSYSYNKVFAQELVCDPTEACLSASAGTQVVDPDECHSYYICITKPDGTIAPSIQSLKCDDGTYFDYTQHSCVEEVNSCANPCRNHVCQHACKENEAGSIASQTCDQYFYCLPDSMGVLEYCKTSPNLFFDGTQCSDDPYSCCDICTQYCETEYTEVYDPYDCTKYYLCLANDYTPSEETHFSCPEGQKFDELTSDCVDDTGSCTPVCTSSSV